MSEYVPPLRQMRARSQSQAKACSPTQLQDKRPTSLPAQLQDQRSISSSPVLQGAFRGATGLSPALDQEACPGHVFTHGGTQPLTGCGLGNTIATDGRYVNHNKSDPGAPVDFLKYKDFYKYTGGLVRDKTLNQASTKMHIINHRLDSSNNTQGVASNIFLGTKNSNNPTHLHDVENPVINSLSYRSLNNLAYEDAMNKSFTSTLLQTGAATTAWTQANCPTGHAVDNKLLQNAWYLDPSQPNQGVTLTPAPNRAADVVIMTTLPSSPSHLWARYSVSVNYGGPPPHISTNVSNEEGYVKELEAQRDDLILKNSPNNAALVQKNIDYISNNITTFKAGWDQQALASSFTCNATYHYASYNKAYPYNKATETSETIAADL